MPHTVYISPRHQATATRRVIRLAATLAVVLGSGGCLEDSLPDACPADCIPSSCSSRDPRGYDGGLAPRADAIGLIRFNSFLTCDPGSMDGNVLVESCSHNAGPAELRTTLSDSGQVIRMEYEDLTQGEIVETTTFTYGSDQRPLEAHMLYGDHPPWTITFTYSNDQLTSARLLERYTGADDRERIYTINAGEDGTMTLLEIRYRMTMGEDRSRDYVVTHEWHTTGQPARRESWFEGYLELTETFVYEDPSEPPTEMSRSQRSSRNEDMETTVISLTYSEDGQLVSYSETREDGQTYDFLVSSNCCRELNCVPADQLGL